jgi:predicted dehydrogenase
MIGIGLIGYGYWGPNLARNLLGMGATIVAVSDLRNDRLVLARAHHTDVDPVRHWQDVILNPKVDAVVIATPPSTHFQIALDSLIARKHVLVEKPITTASDHARRLVDLAATTGLTLMVDHTYLYANSIQTIRHMIAGGKLGQLQYYDSRRIGPRPPFIDVDVLWDLAAHDIAILDHIFELRPEGVAAIGVGHPVGSAVEDVSITFTFGSGFVSRVHVGWLAPTKIRRMLIGGSRRMISYDDMEPIEKLKIRDHAEGCGCSGSEETRNQVGGAPGEAWTPKLDTTEPLAAVAREFLDCIAAGRQPRADGASGLRVVEVLEVASASLQRGGRMLRFPDAVTM